MCLLSVASTVSVQRGANWAKIRARLTCRLQEHHRNPNNRHILIQAWVDYVTREFEQPTSAGLDSIVRDNGFLIPESDDDEIQVAAPLPPPNTP